MQVVHHQLLWGVAAVAALSRSAAVAARFASLKGLPPALLAALKVGVTMRYSGRSGCVEGVHYKGTLARAAQHSRRRTGARGIVRRSGRGCMLLTCSGLPKGLVRAGMPSGFIYRGNAPASRAPAATCFYPALPSSS